MSVIRSISSLTKYPAMCLSAVPANAWLVTAVAVPIFLFIRSLFQRPRLLPYPSARAPDFERDTSIETSPMVNHGRGARRSRSPKAGVIGGGEGGNLGQSNPAPKKLVKKMQEAKEATETFNRLLKKHDLNSDEGKWFRELWDSPDKIECVDLRNLPAYHDSHRLNQFINQFGSDKVITD